MINLLSASCSDLRETMVSLRDLLIWEESISEESFEIWRWRRALGVDGQSKLDCFDGVTWDGLHENWKQSSC